MRLNSALGSTRACLFRLGLNVRVVEGFGGAVLTVNHHCVQQTLGPGPDNSARLSLEGSH